MRAEKSLKANSKDLAKNKDKNAGGFYVKESLSILWKYLTVYKKTFVWVIVLSLLYAAINVGAIIGIYYVFQDLSQIIVPHANVEAIQQTITNSLAILLCAYVIGAVFYVIQVVLMVKVAQRVGLKIRKDLFNKLQIIKVKYFDQNSSGNIMSRLTNDTNNVTIALSQNLTQFIVIGLQVTSMLIAMFVFSPYIALIVLGISPFMFGAVFVAIKKSQPYFYQTQKRIGLLNGYAEEKISGHKIMNAFNKKSKFQGSFDKINNDVISNDTKSQVISGLTGPWNLFMSNFLQIVAYGIAIVFAVNNIEFGGAVTTIYHSGALKGTTDYVNVLSLIGIFVLFLSNYTNPIFQLFQLLNTIQGAFAGTRRFQEILVQPNENLVNEFDSIKSIEGDVKVNNLNFSYDGKRNVLKNISFHAKPGQMVAIVGPTGSGKTTFINLLTKFYNITSGNFEVEPGTITPPNGNYKVLPKGIKIIYPQTFDVNDIEEYQISNSNDQSSKISLTIILKSGYTKTFDELNGFISPIYAKANAKSIGIENQMTKDRDKIDSLSDSGEKVEVSKSIDFAYVEDTKLLAEIDQTISSNSSLSEAEKSALKQKMLLDSMINSDILIDNISIKEITKASLRRNTSVVLQETFLFGESVMNNIRLGNPKATDEQVIQAAKVANADHFIRSLEKGYQTILKDDGEDLSLGQKQLLAIARAVLRNANILILDEATSSIDTKTEKDIQLAMLNLMKNKTSFVIAHRLSTIKNANLILVLKDGQIIERGSHDELMDQKGFYFDMYTSARLAED